MKVNQHLTLTEETKTENISDVNPPAPIYIHTY